MKNYQAHHGWKTHLHNLPNIEDFPQYQGYSNFACLLIPIFTFDKSTEYIENYIAKTAAWSLKTWIENSDASLFNIPCYLYVESSIADTALPILRKNGVPQDNIIISEYLDTAWLAKCLQPVFDVRLEKYEYIIISDIDMFALRGEGGENLQMFENIRRHKPLGFGCRVFHETLPIYWMPHMQELVEYTHGEFHGNLIDIWCEHLESITGRNDLRQHVDGGQPDDRPWTGVMVIPHGTFRDKDWFSKVCKTFGDDEVSVYVWLKQSESHQMWDVESINIARFTDIIDYINICFEIHGLRAAEGGLNSLEFRNICFPDACLLHHFASPDNKFYQAIGL